MKKIVIRTLGGKRIGYGHYYRCLSLAKAIQQLENHIEIIFVINEELVSLIKSTGFNFIVADVLSEDFKIIDKLNVSLFIFDSYIGDDTYLNNIKLKSKLMLIDDNNAIYNSSIPDIIYNGNIHASKLKYCNTERQLKLLGLQYLIMKEEYWEGYNPDVNKDGILITTGGTDEYGITLNIIQQIKNLDIEIKVVIGPGYTKEYITNIEDIIGNNVKLIYQPASLKKYIASSDIVITAGGSTIYEVLSQKSMPIVFSIADNQDLICKELMRMGVNYIGKYPYIDYSLLMGMIDILKCNKVIHNNKIFGLVKGDGAKLVAEAILSIV